MPIYEYACKACGFEFEELMHSSAERDKARCPECKSGNVARKFSVFSAQSAGSQQCRLASEGACSSCCHPDGTCPL